jgi:excisionase family DNA binding protein
MPYVGGKLLTLREAAGFLNVPERTLRAEFRKWGIEAYKVGRAWRFRERDLNDFLEQNKAA